MSIGSGSDVADFRSKQTKEPELTLDQLKQIVTSAVKDYLDATLPVRDAALIEKMKVEITRMQMKTEPNGNTKQEMNPLQLVNNIGDKIAKAIGGEPQDLATQIIMQSFERSMKRDELIDRVITEGFFGSAVSKAVEHKSSH